jgi:hypothetical protein
MFRMISSFISLAAIIVIISSCTCSYCEKLEYRDTQSTIESDVQKQAQVLAQLSDIQQEDILNTLRTVLAGNSRIFGSAYATAPYDENGNLIKMWYAWREGGEIKTLENDAYDLSNTENNNWYRKSYSNKKPMWSIPYYYISDTGKKYYITTYSYPVLEKGEVKFVLTADYLLSTK